MSKYKKFSKLVQEVIKSLSMYSGTSVQIYAEDRIAMMLQRCYNQLFDDHYWTDTIEWFKYTLSGFDGLCNEDVGKDITSFHDIMNISTENNPQYSLRKLHTTTNPYLIVGDTPAYYTSTNIENKIFRIVPFDAKGTIYVQARKRITEFDEETIVNIDPDLLVLHVCWEYCIDDGNNRTAADKFMQMFTERKNTLLALENQGTFDYNDEEAYVGNNSWR